MKQRNAMPPKEVVKVGGSGSGYGKGKNKKMHTNRKMSKK